MKNVRYSQEKDAWLRKVRNVGFQDITDAVQQRQVLAILEHPNKIRFPNQYLLIVNIKEYAYVVPFVETEREIFLKTIFRSRKYTKRYIKK